MARPTPSLELAHTTIDTPVGPLLLVASQQGLVQISFECEGFDEVLDGLAGSLDGHPVSGPSVPGAPQQAPLEQAARQIDQYFHRARTTFEVAVDPLVLVGFRGDVQRHLTTIGYGQTASYAQVAEELGRPGAVRAVGTGCATNPVPIVLPCHRVVRSDGALGGYRGGLEIKQRLLDLEAQNLAAVG